MRWHEFVGDVLSQYVAFSVPDELIQDGGPAWWGLAINRGLIQFVRQNELAPLINRHLEHLQGLDRVDRSVS